MQAAVSLLDKNLKPSLGVSCVKKPVGGSSATFLPLHYCIGLSCKHRKSPNGKRSICKAVLAERPSSSQSKDFLPCLASNLFCLFFLTLHPTNKMCVFREEYL